MTHLGDLDTTSCAIAELRAARNEGGEWTEAQIKLLRRAVNILLGQPGQPAEAAAIFEHLKKAKIIARASYVDTHAHSHFCYAGVTRADIIIYSQRPTKDGHYKIAELIREHFSPVGNAIDDSEFLDWKHGLRNIGHRGKLLEAMKEGSLARTLLKDIHFEILDFLEWTKPLNRYLLH
jgi:hypothetical protein